MVVGGPIYEARGPRTMFRVFSGIAFGYIFVLLAFIVVLGMRKRPTTTDQVPGLLNYITIQFLMSSFSLDSDC
jgi:hypothetical protein